MKQTLLTLLAAALIGCTADRADTGDTTDSAMSQEGNWLEHYRVEQWHSRTAISVANPHESRLEQVPVTVPIGDLKISGADFSPGNFYVYDHQAGETPLFQVDVPEGKELNEIVFLASLDPGRQKTYHLYYAENGQAWPKQERYTQATNMPGWESELMTYRSYGPLAIDLFARSKGFEELMLQRYYDAGNQQIYDYHEESKFGLDILHLGSTAGLAGVGIYGKDGTVLARAPFDSEVVVSGPVRSIVEMNMESWQSEFGDVSISRRATIYAHHYETQLEDRVTGVGDEDARYAVGIRKVEKAEVDLDEDRGLFLQWHNQGEDIGEAGIGIHLQPEDIEEVVEDEGNHFVLVRPPSGEPLRFWAYGAWKRGETVEDVPAFRRRAERIRQQQLPPEVTIGKIQYPPAGR